MKTRMVTPGKGEEVEEGTGVDRRAGRKKCNRRREEELDRDILTHEEEGR